MGLGNSFDTVYNGVKLTVEFETSGPIGHGDECEMDMLRVYIGEQDVTDLLDSGLLNALETECWKHIPEGPEPDRDEEV